MIFSTETAGEGWLLPGPAWCQVPGKCLCGPLELRRLLSRRAGPSVLPTRAKVSLRPARPFPLTLLSLPHLCQRPLNTFASAL